MCAVCRQRLGSFCSQSPVPASAPQGIRARGEPSCRALSTTQPAQQSSLWVPSAPPLLASLDLQPGSPPPRNKAAYCHFSLPISHFSPPTPAAGLLPTCSTRKISPNQVGAGYQYGCWIPVWVLDATLRYGTQQDAAGCPGSASPSLFWRCAPSQLLSDRFLQGSLPLTIPTRCLGVSEASKGEASCCCSWFRI